MTVKKIRRIALVLMLLMTINISSVFAGEIIDSDMKIADLHMTTAGITEAVEGTVENIGEADETAVTEEEATGETAAESNTEGQEAIRYNNEGHELIESYSFEKPDGIDVDNIEYNQYNIGYFYVVAVNSAVNIRQEPTVDSAVVRQLGFYSKMNAFEKVKGQYIKKSDSDEWYRVYWYEKDQIKTGYIYSKVVRFRTFRLGMAMDQINQLDDYLKDHDNMAKISNYKNANGWAPSYKGQKFDALGNQRDQSAPLYETSDGKGEFRYLPDGMIVDVLGAENGMYKVHVFDHEANGYIPKKYLSFQNQVKDLKQVIFVDIKNQNISSYEYADDLWHLKSLSYATTGMEAEFKEPTVPGTYAAIQKKDKFLYLDDVTKELDGYAPYAIRFNGGAYLHGFPVNYKWNTVQELVKEAEYDEQGVLLQEAVYEEKRVGSPIDPGLIEYSYTLGTIPLSHKCVRNPTSHAEFLYNWIVLNEAMIIVVD